MLPINTVICGDARQVLKTFEDETFHHCITDPPYELGFMGKKWDKTGIAYDSLFWKEVLRVLKPGGFCLAFGGSRTHHRIWCAIEDAGFEIRDTVMWLYGSGFPKSLDVSKAIDKEAGAEREVIGEYQTHDIKSGGLMDRKGSLTVAATVAAKEWQGWGTALKPAFEPIVIARKPIVGTVAQNVQKHGTGVLNIDECRIGIKERIYKGIGAQPNKLNNHSRGDTGIGLTDGRGKDLEFAATGRWPANIMLDEEVAVAVDDQSGILKSGNYPARRSADKHRTVYGGWKGEQCLVHRQTDTGGASRFFYTAKASPSERGKNNNHPTVKPIALIEYLMKLISRRGDLILDCFGGSGTTARVATLLGRDWILIDQDERNVEIADDRRKVTPMMF